LPEILRKLNDHADPKHCQVIFRPSFGRRGGTGSAQFGEFDFILLSANSIYLGESKWDRSPEGEQGGKIDLREEQNLRHRIFAFYVERYAFGTYTSWTQFLMVL